MKETGNLFSSLWIETNNHQRMKEQQQQHVKKRRQTKEGYMAVTIKQKH
jgi:hypothetical protein